jgi:hypothetical protein
VTLPPIVDDRSRTLRQTMWRWAFGAAIAVQLIVLYAPSAPGGPPISGLDKVVHVSVFAAPTLAALMAGIPVRWALATLAILIVQAPVSELIQHFVLPHRAGDVLDALADLGGVALAGLGYLVWNRRRH